MTSEMPRTHWMPWMAGFWMAGNLEFKWQDTDVLRHRTVAVAVVVVEGKYCVYAQFFKYKFNQLIKLQVSLFSHILEYTL